MMDENQIENQIEHEQAGEHGMDTGAYAMPEGLADDSTTDDDGQDFDDGEAPEARLEYLSGAMEALLFMHDKPVTVSKLRALIDPTLPIKHYRQAMETLREDYRRDSRGLEIVEVSDGLQIRTKPHMAPVLRKLVKTTPLKLTAAMMEVLSVVAYKQPVTKDEIDQIRGVDCGYLLRTLMDKKLIRITGRSELPGRPILYGITHDFLELFNLKDVTQLPPLHEIEAMVAASEVGDEDTQVAELEEFGKMVDASVGHVLFDDSKLDDELEAIRGVIDEVSTSTEYLDYQKAHERYVNKAEALRTDGKTEEEILEALGPEPVAPWHAAKEEANAEAEHAPDEALIAAAEAAQEERHEELLQTATEGLEVEIEMAQINQEAAFSVELSTAEPTESTESAEPAAPTNDSAFELP
jgi:segregation and condensation protein B